MKLFLVFFSLISSTSTAFTLLCRQSTTSSMLHQSSNDAATSSFTLSLSKPLGLMLEEVVENEPKGVFVKDVGETGSAVDKKDDLIDMQIVSVQGENVQQLDFDSVMQKIVDAPETVEIEFAAMATTLSSFSEGTPVDIVYENGKDRITINAKVGDNLRKVLLENNIEVYQGLKQKLGNCGGAGQCTFCAMDFIESQGWEERSEYEDDKLKKNPQARLACLNSIQGPATIRKASR